MRVEPHPLLCYTSDQSNYHSSQGGLSQKCVPVMLSFVQQKFLVVAGTSRLLANNLYYPLAVVSNNVAK